MTEQLISTFLTDFLPATNRQDVLALFRYLTAQACRKVEDTLIHILEDVLERNSENAEINEDDFSTIHLLALEFDRRYKQWCELTENPLPHISRASDNDLLLACCTDRKRMSELMWGIYTYLEGDYPEPYSELVYQLRRYRELRETPFII